MYSRFLLSFRKHTVERVVACDIHTRNHTTLIKKIHEIKKYSIVQRFILQSNFVEMSCEKLSKSIQTETINSRVIPKTNRVSLRKKTPSQIQGEKIVMVPSKASADHYNSSSHANTTSKVKNTIAVFGTTRSKCAVMPRYRDFHPVRKRKPISRNREKE